MGYLQNEDIKSAAELVSAGGAANQLPNADKIWVTAFGKTLAQAIADQDIGAPPVFGKNTLTLSAGDIAAGFKDLTAQAIANSLDLANDETKMFETRDYTLSVVSGKTRVTFVNRYALGGDLELQEGDILYAEFTQV